MTRLSRRHWAASLAVLLQLSITACAAAGSTQSSDTDLAEIRRFLETAGEAVNSGDVEAEVARFTEDGIYMWPDAPSIEGHQALREWFQQRFARVVVTLNAESEELQVCGDWAFERGVYVAEIRPRSAEQATTVRGKYLNILRRSENGSWKIARRIRNRDHPLIER